MGEEDWCSHRHVLLRFLTALLLIEVSPCAASDAEALLVIKSQIGTSMNIDVLADWNGSNPCNWTGIKCGGPSKNRVVTLSLPKMNLTGTLDPVIGNLSSLQTLNLSWNFFSGPIPPELRNCNGLKSLDLSRNSFDGNFSALFELRNLKVLNLATNLLTDAIPSTVGRLESLQVLNLRNIRLYGEIPVEIGNCTSLRRINLSRNRLSGSLPPTVFLLNHLRGLVLMGTHLEGRLQQMESRAFGLRRLSLSGNDFSGQLPGFLSNLTELQILKLAKNSFTGSIPSVSGLTKLEILDLSSNSLSGGIPTGFGKLLALRDMRLFSNVLQGPIPQELFNCRNLTSLILYDNQLSSQIPSEIGNLSFLKYLELNDNKFTGEIPAQLANCSRLVEINITTNFVSGGIPVELATIINLTRFAAANNQLTGGLPPALLANPKLEYITLTDNMLTGSIPDNFTKPSQLLNLELGGNQLTGSFPFSLASLRRLQKVDASRNLLSGTMAAGFHSYDTSVAGLQLQSLLLYDNRLTGELLSNWTGLNNLQILDLHGNDFEGPIPRLAQHLFQVQVIDLSSNRLEGPIPSDILFYAYLSVLNLSFNRINGGIPPGSSTPPGPSGSSMIVDLSSNNLSGAIPETLNLPNITLNVSNNNLSGSIPPLLQRLGTRAFFGNPSLCGPPLTNECHAAAVKGKKRREVNFIVIGVVLGCWACAFVAALAVFKGRLKAWYVAHCHFAVQVEGIDLSRSSVTVVWTWFGDTCSHDEASEKSPKLSPSLSDLSHATGGFSSARIIGDGGFGKVYKGVLSDGTPVAVKKLTEDGYQGEREFDAELETLGCIKHQNLVRLFGYCSNNFERLLVYEYMPNNSLDTWLHGREDGMEPLPWPVRIIVARDVARGLTFLHHFCIPKIIHRDLKASNILLDENFNARLGDFGLARHLNTYDSHISTAVAGSLGYIAPEYAQSWRVTTRGDVFSFGVVLLELLSGKRPACGSYMPNQGGNLVGWVQHLFHSKKILESFFDKSLALIRGSDIEKALMRVLDIAIRCTHEDPSKRPIMLEVLRTLEGDLP